MSVRAFEAVVVRCNQLHGKFKQTKVLGDAWGRSANCLLSRNPEQHANGKVGAISASPLGRRMRHS
jgi:hypothetical protein